MRSERYTSHAPDTGPRAASSDRPALWQLLESTPSTEWFSMEWLLDRVEDHRNGGIWGGGQ